MVTEWTWGNSRKECARKWNGWRILRSRNGWERINADGENGENSWETNPQTVIQTVLIENRLSKWERLSGRKWKKWSTLIVILLVLTVNKWEKWKELSSRKWKRWTNPTATHHQVLTSKVKNVRIKVWWRTTGKASKLTVIPKKNSKLKNKHSKLKEKVYLNLNGKLKD